MDVEHEASFREINKVAYYSYGSLFFLCVRAIVFPAAVLKTRLQTSAARSAKSLSTLKTILRSEGVFALYQGFPISALGAVPTQMIYLTSLEVSKQKSKAFLQNSLNWSHEDAFVAANLIAGGVASAFSQIMQCPIDVVSQRLMIQDRRINSTSSSKEFPRDTIQLISHIFKNEGVLGFYRGFLASVITYVPNSAIWWGTYSFLKRIGMNNLLVRDPIERGEEIDLENGLIHKIKSYNSNLTNSNFYRFLFMSSLAGAFSGITSAVVTNPMDVIKTRLQTNIRGELTKLGSISKNNGQWRMFWKEISLLWKEEGLSGFRRGMGARAANTIPVSVSLVNQSKSNVFCSNIYHQMLLTTSYELVRRLSTN
ncbi:hypothetical protein HK096_002884 [Nowakowskiella sp. JEL0078]|nr:hypothetical protein HK096_002884 [Nowakowskiella sp. JEL0078]